MKKITELTKEQELKMQEYVDKWIKIGIGTNRPEDNALDVVEEYYRMGDLDAPETVVVCPSPWAAVNYSVHKVSDKVSVKVRDKVYDKVDIKVRDKVDIKVYDKVDGKVSVKVYDKVDSKVSVKVYDKVDDKVYDKVNGKVYGKVNDKVNGKVDIKVYDKVNGKVYGKVNDKVQASNIWSSRVGLSFWAGWQARCDYYDYLGIDVSEIKPRFKLSENFCYAFPFDNLLILSEKPSFISLVNDELHNPLGPAIEWPDGFCIYLLNGVRMCGQEWFFDSSMPDNEKAKKIMSIENVEQRSEAIRAFGMSKIYSILGKDVIDVGSDGYELWQIDVGTGRKEEYLKMVNPSTDEIHVECVPRGVTTAEDALKLRVPQRMRDKYGYKKAIARA